MKSGIFIRCDLCLTCIYPMYQQLLTSQEKKVNHRLTAQFNQYATCVDRYKVPHILALVSYSIAFQFPVTRNETDFGFNKRTNVKK